MKKLSIIIPVYNTEKYITRCVDSLIHQEGNIEILLIDDGSSDSSGIICDDYAHKDKRVKVIHQKNTGVSNARNRALESFTGDYFTFIDSDDWVDETFVSDMFNYLADEAYDILVYSRFFNDDNKQYSYKSVVDEITKYDKTNMEKIVAATIGYCDEYQKRDNDVFGCVACKIYNRKLLKDTRFVPNFKYGEDTVFVTELLLKANSVLCIPQRYYHYYIHPESATHKENPQITNDVVEMMTYLDNILVNSGYDAKLIKKGSAQRKIYLIFFCIDLSVTRGIENKSFRQSRTILKNIVENSVLFVAWRDVDKKVLKKSTLIKINILKLKMFTLYLFLLKLAKRK